MSFRIDVLVNKLKSVLDYLGSAFNTTDNYVTTALKGGVGYENPPDAWKFVKVGQRWNAVLNYTTALAASSSYTSDSITAQDSAGNNFTEIRVSLHQEGSTDVEVHVEQSSDNSTWYEFPNQRATLSSDGNTSLVVDILRPYIRVVESNNDASNAMTKNDLYVTLL